MAKSKALKKLEDGSYFDRITDFIRYGDKRPLNEEDTLVFERIERAKQLLLEKKDQALVIKMLRHEPLFAGLALAQLYNYVADAKALYALVELFNYSYELLIQKERIDKLFKLAEEEKDGRMFATALEENRKWIVMMREEEERNTVEEERSYSFVFHMDPTKLPGITQALLDEWGPKVQEIKRRAAIKFKDVVELKENSDGSFS